MSSFSRLLQDGRCREDLRQFVWFGVGYVVVLALGYLLLRQINLSLTVEEMGRFSFAVSTVGLTVSVLYMAPVQAYLRFHDVHRISPALRRSLLPVFASAAVGVAAILWWRTGSWCALLYAGVPFFYERVHVFRAQMRVLAVNVLKIVELGIPILGLLLWRGEPTAVVVLALYGCGYLSAFFFPLRLRAAEAPSCGVLAKFLVPVAFTTVVAMMIEHLTVVVAKMMFGYEEAAQIGVAARNLIFVRALFQFFQMFYPVVYFREMKAGRRAVVRLYRSALLAVSVLYVTALAVGAPLVYVLTGAEKYVGSSAVFSMLSVAALCDFAFETFALFFQHEIRTWKTTVVRVWFLVVLCAGLSAVPRLMSVTDFPPASLFAGAVLAASLLSSGPGLVWASVQERRSRT